MQPRHLRIRIARPGSLQKSPEVNSFDGQKPWRLLRGRRAAGGGRTRAESASRDAHGDSLAHAPPTSWPGASSQPWTSPGRSASARARLDVRRAEPWERRCAPTAAGTSWCQLRHALRLGPAYDATDAPRMTHLLRELPDQFQMFEVVGPQPAPSRVSTCSHNGSWK